VFQAFHHTTTKTADLYQCRQRDREPLAEFVRFMQLKSQTPDADDKATISQSVCLAGGWWLVLVCSKRKVLLAGCWWMVCSERKVLLAGGW
jgi:hypothetical protein